VRSGLHPVEIEPGVGQSQQSGAYHGGVFGFAAGHDDIDGEDFMGKRAPTGSNFALYEAWIAAEGLHDGIDLVVRWRDDRQAIRPAAVEIEFNQIHICAYDRQGLAGGLG
jgi:hypothetical protein